MSSLSPIIRGEDDVYLRLTFSIIMKAVTMLCLLVLFFMAGIKYGVNSEMNKANDYVQWYCGEYRKWSVPNVTNLNLSVGQDKWVMREKWPG